MLYEAPLVAFTVLAQTAVGAHLTVNAFEKFGKPPRVTEPRMNIARFAILVVMGLGFLFSTTHLGSPLRAFNALNRIGSAALSNEILTGASFLSLAGLYWLLTILKIGSEGVRKIVNWLSIAVGVIFMFAMANVYQIETVPAWYSPMTTVAFWFTVVTSGLMFGYTLINVLDVTAEKTNRRLMWVGVSLIALNPSVLSDADDLLRRYLNGDSQWLGSNHHAIWLCCWSCVVACGCCCSLGIR